MGFGRYRHTPVVSITLIDALSGLTGRYAITSDTEKGARLAPLRFHPIADAVFYQDIYWNVPFDRIVAASQQVTQRFERWYEHAPPITKTFLAMVALTDTDDQIDTIIDDTKHQLLANYQMDLVDADDCIYQITDYHRVRDPVTIQNALNTDSINWWSQRFEEQAVRVKNAPTADFDEFLLWHNAYLDQTSLIKEHFRSNMYELSGYTLKQGRRLLNRSYRFMEAFFGQKQTRDFCKGKQIEIRAHYFVWKLKLNRSELIPGTLNPPKNHIPYSLDLYNHEGERLASVCVVFQDLPVLDQVVCLGISVSNPEEELDLLRAANIYLLTEAGEKNQNLRTLHLENVTWPNHEQDMEDLRLSAELRSLEGLDRTVCHIDEAMVMDFMDEDTQIKRAGRRDREDELVNQYVQELMPNFGDGVHFTSPHLIEPNPASRLQQLILENYGNTLRQRAREVLYRQRDPIAQRIREELYRRLDVRPDILEYMALPELRYSYMQRLKKAPRLRNFIEHGVFI